MPFGSWKPARRFAAVFTVLAAASALWVIASPLSSVPDEPSHVIKAASVARGELTGEPVPNAVATLVTVPEWVADSHRMTCYAFQSGVTPACADDDLFDSSADVETFTTAGNYNPVYYALVGWPSLFVEGEIGYYSMRLVSALLSCVFLAAALTPLLSATRHRFAAVAVMVTITPMVLFLVGSVNPNSLEVATTASLLVHLLAALRTPATDRLPVSHVVWVTASAALLANTRAASLMWMLVAVVVAIVIAGLPSALALIRRRSVLIGAGVIGLTTAGSLAWTFSQGALATMPFEGAGGSAAGALIVMLERTFDYTTGLVGYFGWLDTPAPSIVLIVWALLVGSLLAVALVVSRGRALLAIVLAAAAYVLIPAVSQALAVPEIGYIWQGRYNLALFAILMIAIGFALDDSGVSWTATTRRAARIGLVLMIAAQAYAWLWALRRYVTGLGMIHPWVDMIRAPQWAPPLGWPIWVIAAIVIFSAIGWLLWRWTALSAEETSEVVEIEDVRAAR